MATRNEGRDRNEYSEPLNELIMQVNTVSSTRVQVVFQEESGEVTSMTPDSARHERLLKLLSFFAFSSEPTTRDIPWNFLKDNIRRCWLDDLLK